MTKVGYPCAPAISTRLECLGGRLLVAINENGGIGGGCAKLVGEISSINTKLVNVKLTESNRKLTVNLAWVSYIEEVTLYKRTHIHTNPNFENKVMIDYMIAKGKEEIVLVQELVHGELKNSKLCSHVNGDKC